MYNIESDLVHNFTGENIMLYFNRLLFILLSALAVFAALYFENIDNTNSFFFWPLAVFSGLLALAPNDSK